MPMATITPSTPPTLPPIPATISVAENGSAVMVTLRLEPDDCLDLLLRALGCIGRIRKIAP